MTGPKVAVVGAGLFGCLAATDLAAAGATVHLYDKHPGIMRGASGNNQGRLHAGFHYPRSASTRAAARAGAALFRARFPDVYTPGVQHWYAIARESRTPPDVYLNTMDTDGLDYRLGRHPLTFRSSVAVSLLVDEELINIAELRRCVRDRLLIAGVELRLGEPVQTPMVLADHGYDHTVFATYGPFPGRTLRYEVVELAIVQLGEQWKGLSFVVMDGNYVSIDPLPDGTHVLYDVAHSVHHAEDGLFAQVPRAYWPLVDRGVIHTRLSRVNAMEQTARRFFHGMGMPGYRGSRFTVRAVLAGVDDTDERPTLVETYGRVTYLHGGKLDTAVEAAGRVVAAVMGAEVPA